MNKKGQSIRTILMLTCGLLVLVFLVSQVKVIQPYEMAVATRFGSVVGVYDKGMRVMPLVDLHKYDMRTRKEFIQLAGTDSSADSTGQYVEAQVAVNYRLKRNKDVIFNLFQNIGEDEFVDETLNLLPIIKEGIKQATVKFDGLEILTRRQEVKDFAKANIIRNFPEQYFEVEQVVVSNIDFSDEFNAAIDAKKTASQLALKAIEDTKRVAEEQKQKILEYEAKAKEIELQAEAVTDKTLFQAWVQRWNGALPSYMIVTEGQSNTLLNLPTLTE